MNTLKDRISFYVHIYDNFLDHPASALVKYDKIPCVAYGEDIEIASKYRLVAIGPFSQASGDGSNV